MPKFLKKLKPNSRNVYLDKIIKLSVNQIKYNTLLTIRILGINGEQEPKKQKMFVNTHRFLTMKLLISIYYLYV